MIPLLSVIGPTEIVLMIVSAIMSLAIVGGAAFLLVKWLGGRHAPPGNGR